MVFQTMETSPFHFLSLHSQSFLPLSVETNRPFFIGSYFIQHLTFLFIGLLQLSMLLNADITRSNLMHMIFISSIVISLINLISICLVT